MSRPKTILTCSSRVSTDCEAKVLLTMSGIFRVPFHSVMASETGLWTQMSLVSSRCFTVRKLTLVDNDTKAKLLDTRQTCFNSEQQNRRKRIRSASTVLRGKASAGKRTAQGSEVAKVVRPERSANLAMGV